MAYAKSNSPVRNRCANPVAIALGSRDVTALNPSGIQCYLTSILHSKYELTLREIPALHPGYGLLEAPVARMECNGIRGSLEVGS
jgi:hypothetical protein